MRRLLIKFIILTIALTFDLFAAHVLAAPVMLSVYEAENGSYSGGAHSQSDPNASGGYIAAYFGHGTSVAITVDGGEAGDYQLSMIYAAAFNDRTMSLYVNNAHISNLRFPGTGGYTTYSTLNTNITLHTGMNIITLQVDNGEGDTGDVNFDYITLAPGITSEKTLEKIEITRPATKLSYRIGESLDITGIEVTGIYNDGSIQVEPITAADVTGFDSSAQVYSQVLTVTYEGQTATYTVTITAPDLTPGKYEAENGAYSGGAHSQFDPNASGGYIAAYFGHGTSVAIAVDGGAGGDYQFSMIYAAAFNDRTMSLYVNHAHISDLRFPGTGGYTTYSTLNTNITLHTGMNIITLQVDNGEGDTGDVNFDYITLAPGKTLEYNLEIQICPVKDNKQAIWTFTTDDGIYNSVVQYNNLFKMYGLKGTVALNPYTIQDTDNGLNWSSKDGLRFYCGTWSLWQTLIADGHLDIANHTATHPHLTQIPQTELDSEINGARSILMSHLNDQSILGFIDPYGESDYLATSVIQQQHFADRSTVEGENSLDPDHYSWYHLRSYYALSGVSVETMNSWIDSTIANKSWCIELWHGILSDDTESETLWSPLTYDICNNHLSYVANNLDKIWNATYSEAIQYIRERQSATLSVLSFDNTHIQLSLSDSLDNSIFNYPLTLKVQVPNDWASVSVVQNGNSHNIIPVTESGNNYVYFDAIPDQGNIDIAKATLERIEITKPATKLSYTVGESLDITGLVVIGIYSNGSIQIEPITAADVTGFDSSVQIDSQVLTVTYEGRTAAYTVTIASATTASNDATLANVLGRSIIIEGGQGSLQDPFQVTIDVDDTVTNLSVSDLLAQDSNAIVTLCGIDNTYTEECDSVDFKVGETTDVYFKIMSEDGVITLYYKVAIICATVTVDKTALNTAITAEIGRDHTNPAYVLSQADYTVTSWVVYVDVLTAAINIEGNISATQSEVEEAIGAIGAAKTSLVNLTEENIKLDGKFIELAAPNQ